MKHNVPVLMCALIIAPALAFGQQYGSIEEIIITAPRGDKRVMPSAIVLNHEALTELQPVATADVFRNMTGLSLRTNSRGESVIRIRGSEERQTLVFLDGAPLATPWDGRADLALLPAGLIDRVEITRGAVPIEYGPNAVAGAVELSTYLPESGGDLRAQVQQGSLGLRNWNLVTGLGLDNGWSFVAGASAIDRDAERIADKNSVEFDPSTTSERTNTDLSGNTGYFATGYAGDSFLLRASVLHADVERGIAAQGDIDPALSSPRFWRYPDWRLTQATLNGAWTLGPNLGLRFTGWRQWFEQTIDAYTDYSYTALENRETGQDDTSGARLTVTYDLERATLRLVSTLQDSTHDNQESETATGDPADLAWAPVQTYRQRLSTIGAEADISLSDTLTSTVGLALDHASTPLTGDKPPQQSLSATGWSAGLRWTPADEWSIAATLGQRSRFPTPREMYGAALGKFLLNPELGPERSLLADLSINYVPSESLSLDISLWTNDSEDTLSQRSVDVDGVSKRQRYNTNGSFTYGIDASATLYLTDDLRAEFSAALQDGQVEPDDDGERPVLLQRPDSQLRAALDWQAGSRLDLRAEVLHTGPAWDIADDGSLVQLPESTSVNLRGFLAVGHWRERDIRLTASVDNLTDALVLPQLGLPAPGRAYRLGIQFN